LAKSYEPVRTKLPIKLLIPSENNPNKMTDREFDLLVENRQRVGHTDAVLVWPFDLKLFRKVWDAHKKLLGAEPTDESLAAFYAALQGEGVVFRIIGGHHRTEAAKFNEELDIPCTVIVDPAFNEEEAEVQLMRHNAIKGRLDPQRFFGLYEKYLTKGYGEDVIQDMFGFADEAEFKKLIEQSAKTLPKDLQQTFREAAAEIKTVDGLAKLLNHMFTMYGDTLPYGYLIMDYGGQQSIWLRLADKKSWDALTLIGQACIEQNRSMDAVIGYVIQEIAKGEQPALVQAAFDNTPLVKMPKDMLVAPTLDNLKKVEGL